MAGIYKNPEARKEYLKNYYKAHKEALRLKHKEYYKAHQEELKKASKKQYRQKCLAKSETEIQGNG